MRAAEARTSGGALLDVRDLTVSFATDGGRVRVLDGVSFDVAKGQRVGLVGESGSGKTVTALSILRLLPDRAGAVDAGTIAFEGRDLARATEREMHEVRGGRVGMVFQEPLAALNPVYTAGAHVVEALRLHLPISRAEAKKRALELLARVGIPRPEERFDAYPHELSGGLGQRVLIAIAIACGPSLLIADEPTTALDRVTEAQILELLAELREQLGMSLLLVSHDLALVGALCDDVVVLYAGQVVERGRARDVLREPRHPYTRALLASVPPRTPPLRRVGRPGPRLPAIEGGPPDLRAPLPGCRFAPRCPDAIDRCRSEEPRLVRSADRDGGWARCLLAEPGSGA